MNDKNKEESNHRKNKLRLASSLEKMSRCQSPYEYFHQIPSQVLGMLHFAAFYLEESSKKP